MKTEPMKTEPMNEKPMNEKPMTLDEALALHNRNHPESKLVDITAAMTTAEIARLHLLLTRKNSRLQADVNASMEFLDTDKERYLFLLLMGTIRASRLKKHGWSSDQAWIALGLQDGDLDPGDRREILTRIRRASRLLSKVVRRGVLRRGEAG